ncbi:MAG: signal peptidase I [Pyrinomonadaceae bacterium]|nr:signal peptidase I [Pyrinomonadaceae bacterium]
MFNLRQKNQLDIGPVSASDDAGIEVLDFRKAARHGIWLESFRLLRDIVLIVFAMSLFLVFVAQPVVVEGTSMVPQLENGERLIVNKLVYYDIESVSWGHIERGDIVVFWYPKDPSKSYVKRVVGLPGETISVREGIVYVDGLELVEPYLDVEHNRSVTNRPAIEIDDHHYFVMGDNRDNSSDSRVFGVVPSKYIYGKAFFRYWRPSGIGFIRGGEPLLEETESEQGDVRAATPE